MKLLIPSILTLLLTGSVEAQIKPPSDAQRKANEEFSKKQREDYRRKELNRNRKWLWHDEEGDRHEVYARYVWDDDGEVIVVDLWHHRHRIPVGILSRNDRGWLASVVHGK